MEPWPLVMPSDEELLSLKPQTIAGPSTAINLDPRWVLQMTIISAYTHPRFFQEPDLRSPLNEP